METITKQFRYRNDAMSYFERYFNYDSIKFTETGDTIYFDNSDKFTHIVGHIKRGKLTVFGDAVLKSQRSNIYQFQTINGRKFNISAANQAEAEDKAIDWKYRNAPKCCICYNFRVD